ncbi:membrane hypothetical protein [Gammaproteobacteria bacterium]
MAIEKYSKISKDWALSLGIDLWRTFTDLPWYYEIIVVAFSLAGVFFLLVLIVDYVMNGFNETFKIFLLLSLFFFGVAIFSDLGLKSLVSQNWAFSFWTEHWQTFTGLPWYSEIVVALFFLFGVFFLFRSIGDYITNGLKTEDTADLLLFTLLSFGITFIFTCKTFTELPWYLETIAALFFLFGASFLFVFIIDGLKTKNPIALLLLALFSFGITFIFTCKTFTELPRYYEVFSLIWMILSTVILL